MTGRPSQRILLDGTMATTGGGFTFLANIVTRLCEAAPQHEFLLWVRNPRLLDEIPEAPNLERRLFPPVGLLGRLRFTWGEAPRLARDWRADVYLAAGDFAPLSAHCPVIASFRNPNVFTELDQGWYAYQVLRLGALRQLGKLLGRRCARIVFVSHDSARWIGESIGLPEAKRRVIHHGVDPRPWRSADPGDLRPCILTVSSIYRYKNFVRLVEAWARLAARRPDLPDLAIVGEDRDPAYSQQLRDAREATGSLAERIHLVGEVAYADLPRWYAAARVFAFPSYLETFGHPLLEALSAGVPVVSADLDVSREVAGDAALYADPHDTDALADALERILYEPGVADELVRRGAERVERFTWQACAEGYLALFDEVATR